MTDATNEGLEEIVLDCEAAKALAKKFRNEADPFTEIPPSLLSAEHIDAYIKKTGLIAPYYEGGGGKSRLKKASYEGRIGDHVYRFDQKAEIVPVPFQDDSLNVPANSIVFVECDLEFRLPQYIALRFNLQIRHVHRGLLLGTGPLVDPGYWGKLCIPLHNLTDEDYAIPLTDGLIWVEFTKTTSDSAEGRVPLETEGTEHFDVLIFLRKASQPFDKNKPRIGIRSSIASAFAEANKNSKEALKTADDTKNFVYKIGVGSIVGIAIAVFAFLFTFVQGTYEQVDETRKHVEDSISSQSSRMNDLKTGVENISTRNAFLKTKVETLEAKNSALRSRYEEMLERLSRLEALSIKPALPGKKIAK